MLERALEFIFGTKKQGDIATAPMQNRGIRARYDAAQTNDGNSRYWAQADWLSANAANSISVRRTLRNRARYEIANNSYAKGIVLTIANDTIGTGARLQLISDDQNTAKIVQSEFKKWAQEVRLAEKLRTLRMAKCGDGEGFVLLANNQNLIHPVKLFPRLIETDQVAKPIFIPTPDQSIDGMDINEFGEPYRYYILKQNPGDVNVRFSLEYDLIPAASILHYFRIDRPGQARGIPELTPALPMFAMLRDYSLATLEAAKAAAYHALVIQSTAPADGIDASTPFETVELERGMATTLPEGWTLGQVKAEQPTSTFKEAHSQFLNEIARCMNIPFNIAAGNSSTYNYASGRMDHQVYFKSIRVEQSQIESVILNPIFDAWFREAVLIDRYLPQESRKSSFSTARKWFFDGAEHVDPSKEANAQETKLRNKTTTLAHEYAKQGLDWRAEIDQAAIEYAYIQSKGLPVVQQADVITPGMAPQKVLVTPTASDDEGEGDENE